MHVLIHSGDAVVPNFSLSQELQKNYTHVQEKVDKQHTARPGTETDCLPPFPFPCLLLKKTTPELEDINPAPRDTISSVKAQQRCNVTTGLSLTLNKKKKKAENTQFMFSSLLHRKDFLQEP